MLRFIIFSRRKKYHKLSGYSANANTRETFLSHVALKFQRVIVLEDGTKKYEHYYTSNQLRKALSRGFIEVALVGIAKH